MSSTPADSSIIKTGFVAQVVGELIFLDGRNHRRIANSTENRYVPLQALLLLVSRFKHSKWHIDHEAYE